MLDRNLPPGLGAGGWAVHGLQIQGPGRALRAVGASLSFSAPAPRINLGRTRAVKAAFRATYSSVGMRDISIREARHVMCGNRKGQIERAVTTRHGDSPPGSAH
ncbi:hypothetical protein NDU88_004527 [Pleurodeles waltl]|uniref:Uncharacterized protein n=1 Tax=Pleurodeles waltl TaxID=8319 RepID=A0AAV7SJ83_PLEWA|nr:hypothetical protein NDU88_004527 [Pleurodeles waltl]